MTRAGLLLAAGLAALLASSLPLRAEARPGRVSATLAGASDKIQGDVRVEADRLSQTRQGDTVLEGAVTLVWQRSRMQADRITFRERRFVEAEGNVLVAWGNNRISGTRMTYDLEEDRGSIENAMGQVDPEFYFSADRAEKIGRDLVTLESATVTTCTQPVPYWSFSVSSATVRLNNYAHMWNLRLRARQIPVFYLPYLLWPVKPDRAAGLLFPEFGTTRNRGRVITQALFLPLGQSADLTVFGEYYTVAGYGGGGEFRLIPNRRGVAVMNGFYIQDRLAGFGRYRATYRQTQEFLNGFRMVADINQVSDFGFFTDFERELRLASSPTILGRLEFTRNGSWTSVNIRDLRREQLFSDGTSLVQRTLPEIEWRGRSRRIGHSPFYIAYESSLASLQQFGTRINADYMRADVFPTVTAPVSPVPWLDITPAISYRTTYYTQHQEPPTQLGGTQVVVVDSSLTRTVGGAGVEIVGPKFSRIYQRPGVEKPSRYKHTFETVMAYDYQQGAKRGDEVLLYDDVDRVIGARNLLTYGLRSRLFARRPRAEQPAPLSSLEPILLPDGTSSPAPPTPEAARGADPGGRASAPSAQEPIQILSFEVRQSRSLDRDQSFGDVNGDRILETSRSSPIEATGRFSPSPFTDLSFRGRYDILFKKVADVSLSGNLRGDVARASFSLVHRAGLGFDTSQSPPVPVERSLQLRLASGVTLFGGRLRVDLDGSYNPDKPLGQKAVPDQRWRFEYYTQCCGFLAEYLSREFSSTLSRNEFRFTVDLRGIGKLLDWRAGEDR